MKFKQLKIGNRLGLGFALILFFLILSTGIGILRLQALAGATHAMMEQPLAKERMISDWYRYVYAGIRRTTAIVKSSDPSLGPFFAEDAAFTVKQSQDLKKRIDEMVSSDEERALFDRLANVSRRYLSTRADITKAKDAGNQEEADRQFEQGYLPTAKEYEGIVQQLLDLQRKSIDASAHQIDAIAADSRKLLIGLAVLVLMLSAFCAWRLTVGITRPIGKAAAMARRIADGDLSQDGAGGIDANSRDESSQLLLALSGMNANLLRIVSQVRAGTETIGTASSEIAAGNLDLSSRTEQQAGSLEETASAMEELTATVKQNAENARQANQLAISAADVAVRGGAVVSEVVVTMASINDASRRIVDIISVIDGIAFQTNILALNAAVEAARAGEEGRGFAVVASEVRSLAQRSAAAAREIKDLIGDSVDKVGSGSALVGQAGATMDEMVASIRHVTDIMAEIAAASDEQSAGIGQVNQAIAQMDQVTQQNAALVEQAAAAADAMHEQARQLTATVSAFRLETQAVKVEPLLIAN
jgi:methyl-accepting chemotaxis protein